MVLLQFITRIILSGLFIVAALGKFLDLKKTRQSITNFGLPVSLSPIISCALPLSETIIAIMLLSTFTAWWGAVGALALLLLFSLTIGINIISGRTPDCNCFGQIHSSPANHKTLSRNLLFSLAPLFIIWCGQSRIYNYDAILFNDFKNVPINNYTSNLLFFITTIVLSYLLYRVYKRNKQLSLKVSHLEQFVFSDGKNTGGGVSTGQLQQNSKAPEFNLKGINREFLSLHSLLKKGKPVLFIFSDPNCGPCSAILPKVSEWQKESAEVFTTAIISRGTIEENKWIAFQFDLKYVLIQQDREVAAAYGSFGTPSAIYIEANGYIGSQLVVGKNEILNLISNKISFFEYHKFYGDNNLNKEQVFASNTSSLPFPLKTRNGQIIDFNNSQGLSTLLIFWNPNCTHCAELLKYIFEWEQDPGKQTLQIVLVSNTGQISPELSLLRSAIVIDNDNKIRNFLYVEGTPSAILFDTTGKRISSLVTGIKSVLGMIGFEHANNKRVLKSYF